MVPIRKFKGHNPREPIAESAERENESDLEAPRSKTTLEVPLQKVRQLNGSAHKKEV